MDKFQSCLNTCMGHFEFPEEAKTELNEAFAKVFSKKTNRQALENVLATYKQNKREGFSAAMAFCKELSVCANVHIYVVNALVLTVMAGESKVHYDNERIPAPIWRENFVDLKYKLIECKLVKGMWGIFVPEWYLGFFDVNRFSFGKLQFELIDFGRSYHKNSLILTEKTPVVNMHIPRTGTSLTPKDVDEACEKAAVFFQEKYGLDEVVFACNSWLLYPENKKMLKPTSNLYSFISRFDIVEVGEYADYQEVWRLFDCDYTGDVALLPADTSFRRAYIERIKRKEKTGYAYGVFAYKNAMEK